MLDDDRFEYLAAKFFRNAAREGLYSEAGKGYGRERLIHRAARAFDARRLGFIEAEEFYYIIATCCRLGIAEGVCESWRETLNEIKEIAAERQREAFIESICRRPEPDLHGRKIRHIEFDAA